MDGGAGGLEDFLKILEARSKEIDSLKRQLGNSERLRQQLETQKNTFDAQQPIDVQNLLSQKRELKTQLQREESEKHELFSQINQLIGELDEIKSARGTYEALHKAQVNQLNLESDELKRDFARKEAAFQKLSSETAQLKSEMERRERIHQLEKSRMEEEISDCQRDIRMKEAAIQSFSLARQTPSNSYTSDQHGHELEQLRVENESLRQELAEKDDLLKESTESNDALTESFHSRGVELEGLRSELERLKASPDLQRLDKCDACEKNAGVMGEMRTQLSSQAAEHTELHATVQRMREENAKLRDRLSKETAELDGVRREIDSLRSKLEREKDELLARLKSTEAELHEVRKEVETRSDDRHSELLREIDEFRKSHDEKARQLAIMEIQSEKALLDLRGEILKQLACVLNPDKDVHNVWQLSEDVLFGQIKELVTKDESNRAKLAEMEEKLAKAESHSAHLTSQLAGVEAESGEVEREKTMRANAEKETQRLSQRLAEIERSCSKLREEVAQLANENDVLKSNLADAHSKLTAASAAGVSKEAVVEDSHSSSSTTSEVEEPHESSTLTVTTLNRRLSELMHENARLAGNLLKQQSDTERSFRDAVAREKETWARERSELEAALRETRHELDTAKSCNNADPVPKPRRLLNGGGETAIAAESPTNAESEEIGRLRSELEKQKRIVTVLRKKLQPAAISSTPKPYTSNEDAAASSSPLLFNPGALTLPRR